MDEFTPIRFPTICFANDGSSGTGQSGLKDSASKMGSRITEGARDLADEQKRKGADGVGRIARAVRSAADQLEQDMPKAAAFIQDAAQHIEETSGQLRDRSISEMIDAAGSFARKQPVAFFGGALVAGFVLSRFLKSSGNAQGDSATRKFS